MSNSADSITLPGPLRRRLTAAAYDGLLLIALFFVVTAGIVAIRRSGVPSGSGPLQFLLAGTAWLYFAWCWVHGGQTVGMRAWKVRVVDHGSPGAPIGWVRASLRFVAAWLPALPLSLMAAGVAWQLATGIAGAAFVAGFGASRFERDRRCWHDILTGTRLILAY